MDGDVEDTGGVATNGRVGRTGSGARQPRGKPRRAEQQNGGEDIRPTAPPGAARKNGKKSAPFVWPKKRYIQVT